MNIYTADKIELEQFEDDEMVAIPLIDNVFDDDEDEEEDEGVQMIPLFEEDEAVSFNRRKLFSNKLIVDEAFKYYRTRDFPYRDLTVAQCMTDIQKLSDTEGSALINTSIGYSVADTFHKHRVHAAAQGMGSPFSAFNDDVKLRKALKMQVKFGGNPTVSPTGVLSLVNGTQACSNFRPGFAAYLYRKYCKEGATVLDTSTGYGGRLLGAVASQVVDKYIGIDPHTLTHNANVKMVEDLCLNSICGFELYNLPAEDVPSELLRGRCDFSFTSPPYFSKEIYSDEETQSWKRYPTPDSWVAGFLEPMMRLTYDALKPNCLSVVNIGETIRIKGKLLAIADWVLRSAKQAGFEYVETETFPMQTRMRKRGVGDDTAISTEPVLIFRKP